MQPARRIAEQRVLLFEVNIDTAKEDRLAVASIFSVHPDGQIERKHRRVVTQLAQRSDEGVVVETISTKHASGAGRELDDVHAFNLTTMDMNLEQSYSGDLNRARIQL